MQAENDHLTRSLALRKANIDTIAMFRPIQLWPCHLVVKEPWHLSTPECSDLPPQPVPKAYVVEPRYRGGDIVVQLSKDGLARRVKA